MMVAGRKAKEREDDALCAQRATSGKPRGSCPGPTRASSSIGKRPKTLQGNGSPYKPRKGAHKARKHRKFRKLPIILWGGLPIS